MDKHSIDSHKMMFHPHRVSDWLNNKPIFPIYIEICPYGGCNHRCSFCAYNFTKYKPIALDTKLLKDQISNMASIGLKAIMFAGEGEPLLHKEISSIINHTKRSGIDVSVTTNGSMLTKEFARKSLESISWIKVSVDAGQPDTFAKIHGTNANEFNKILNNLEKAVKVRNDNHYTCTIGAQALLVSDNANELSALALRLKEIGVDYFVVKPFSEHPYREGERNNLKYEELLNQVSSQLTNFKSKGMDVITRFDAFRRLKQKRIYEQCLSLDFWAFIDATGEVYACSNFLKNKQYSYGNIHDSSFEELWKARKRVDINLSDCRHSCRMDMVNQYLWELKNPPDHVNFL